MPGRASTPHFYSDMQESRQYKVLLVDDLALVRAGIRCLVERIDGFSMVKEASGIRTALHALSSFAADIVITDISLGSESGLDLIPEIKLAYPDAAVMILSTHACDDMVAEALRRGAAGYLLKQAAPAELEIALRAVTRKEIYFSPAVSTRLVNRFLQTPTLDPGVALLTPRQLEILKLIASRKSTKEIAYQLDLSEKTIAAHRSQIMERLKVRDVVGLALFAVKHGLVDKPE
jgi:DNA-binding NarL/FixJ family response regulator